MLLTRVNTNPQFDSFMGTMTDLVKIKKIMDYRSRLVDTATRNKNPTLKFVTACKSCKAILAISTAW